MKNCLVWARIAAYSIQFCFSCLIFPAQYIFSRPYWYYNDRVSSNSVKTKITQCNNYSFTDFEDVPNIVWKSCQVSSADAYYQLIVLFLSAATPMKMRLKAARFLQQKSLDCSFQTKTKPLQGSKAFSALSLCPGYICNNGGGTRAMEWKINTMPSIAYIYHILYVNICWCWICHKSQNLRKWLYVGLVSAVIFFSFMFVSFSIKPSLGF